MSVQPGEENEGNDYVGQTGVSTKRPVITGYADQEKTYSVPKYLAPPSTYQAPFKNFQGAPQLDGTFNGVESYSIPQTVTVQNAPVTASQEDLVDKMYTLMAQDPDAYQELEDLLRKTRFSSWESFFDSASRQDRPWDEYLVMRAGLGEGRGGGGGPTSQVYLSSESQAGALLDEAFTQYLGRTASDDEVKVWTELLNKAQMANPATSTGGSASVQRGGFEPSRMARSYAQSQEGYAERFTALNFMSALDQALSNRGTGIEEFARGEA